MKRLNLWPFYPWWVAASVYSFDRRLAYLGLWAAVAGLLMAPPNLALADEVARPPRAAQPQAVAETSSNFKTELLQETTMYNKEERNYFRNELTPAYAWSKLVHLEGYVAASSKYNSKVDSERFEFEDSEINLVLRWDDLRSARYTRWKLAIGGGGVIPTASQAAEQTETGGYQILQETAMDAGAVIVKLSNYYYSYFYRYIDYFPA